MSTTDCDVCGTSGSCDARVHDLTVQLEAANTMIANQRHRITILEKIVDQMSKTYGKP